MCLVYCQGLGEPGITGCNAVAVRSSHELGIHLQSVDVLLSLLAC